MKRKIGIALLAIMLFSSLSGYAYANAFLTDFSKYTSPGTFTTVTDAARKERASDVGVELRNSGFASTYRVRVMGCSSSGANPVNYTYYNFQAVNYVVCNRDTLYGIDNIIAERNCTHAVLSVYPIGGSGTTTGQWSPDTLQTFATPESAG